MFSQSETSTSRIFSTSEPEQTHRSSVRVNLQKYEKKIHDNSRHEAFNVLSDKKRTDLVLRHPTIGVLAKKKVLKTSTLSHSDSSAAGGRPSFLLRGEGDSVTAWRPSLVKNVGHIYDDNTVVAGKASKDIVYQHAARDSAQYFGIKTNKFSAISRGDKRNIITDDRYENQYKQKRKYERRDSLTSDLLESEESHSKGSMTSPRKSKKVDLNLPFQNNVSPVNTSCRVIHTNMGDGKY